VTDPPAQDADPTAADPLAVPVNPPAATAGEEDHSDPWAFAGEDADPPADTGKPPAEG
jgi:hypothetical protein